MRWRATGGEEEGMAVLAELGVVGGAVFAEVEVGGPLRIGGIQSRNRVLDIDIIKA